MLYQLSQPGFVLFFLNGREEELLRTWSVLVLYIHRLPILDFPNRRGVFISLFSFEEPETQVGHVVNPWEGRGPNQGQSVSRTLLCPRDVKGDKI